jgi:hypothetical protein
LLGLSEESLFVPYKRGPKRDTVVSDDSKLFNFQSRRGSRQLNDRIGQGDSTVERGCAAEHTVMADHRHFNHLAGRKTDNE